MEEVLNQLKLTEIEPKIIPDGLLAQFSNDSSYCDCGGGFCVCQCDCGYCPCSHCK